MIEKWEVADDGILTKNGRIIAAFYPDNRTANMEYVLTRLNACAGMSDEDVGNISSDLNHLQLYRRDTSRACRSGGVDK